MKPIVFYLLAILITFSSCQNKKQEASGSGSEKERTLVLGAMSSMDFIPVAIAKKMDYFKENGVNVTIEKFYSANDRDAAFQSGTIDGTVIDYTGAVLQNAGGIGLKLTSACNAPFAIISSPGGTTGNIKDLKDKKIAISRNTVIDFCIDMALQSAGMSETDVEKVEINKIPLRFEMLMKGEVQATALPDPFRTMSVLNGCTSITDMQELGYQITGIMFSQEAIDTKGEEIKAFYKAYNKGVDYIGSHSVEDMKDVLIQDAGFPEDLIGNVVLPEYTHARIPEGKDIQATVKWLKDKKLIPENFEGSVVLDNQFVK